MQIKSGNAYAGRASGSHRNGCGGNAGGGEPPNEGRGRLSLDGSGVASGHGDGRAGKGEGKGDGNLSGD